MERFSTQSGEAISSTFCLKNVLLEIEMSEVRKESSSKRWKRFTRKSPRFSFLHDCMPLQSGSVDCLARAALDLTASKGRHKKRGIDQQTASPESTSVVEKTRFSLQTFPRTFFRSDLWPSPCGQGWWLALFSEQEHKQTPYTSLWRVRKRSTFQSTRLARVFNSRWEKKRRKVTTTQLILPAAFWTVLKARTFHRVCIIKRWYQDGVVCWYSVVKLCSVVSRAATRKKIDLVRFCFKQKMRRLCRQRCRILEKIFLKDRQLPAVAVSKGSSFAENVGMLPVRPNFTGFSELFSYSLFLWARHL